MYLRDVLRSKKGKLTTGFLTWVSCVEERQHFVMLRRPRAPNDQMFYKGYYQIVLIYLVIHFELL